MCLPPAASLPPAADRWAPKQFLWTKLYPRDVILPEVGLVISGILIKDGPLVLTHNAIIVNNPAFTGSVAGPFEEDTYFQRQVKLMICTHKSSGRSFIE